jgi:hypothetical protein
MRWSVIECAGPLLWVGVAPIAQDQTGSPFNRKEIVMSTLTGRGLSRVPWNKGRLTGQKPPLKLKSPATYRDEFVIGHIVKVTLLEFTPS